MTAPDLIAAGYSLVGAGTVQSVTLYPPAPPDPEPGEASSDLIAAAEAYRAERARYWVRRQKVGETTTPFGTTATFATQVLNHDQSQVLLTGDEPTVKAWLDQTCLKAALRQLLVAPSAALVAAAGDLATLQRVVLRLVPRD